MVFEEYRFLRYFIPGSLYVIYMTFLVVPNLSVSVCNYISTHPNLLLGAFAGAFGASVAFGYVFYTFYDSFLANHLAMNENNRPILQYLARRINTWPNRQNYEKKAFLDTLYHRLGESGMNQQFSEKIRGIWSNFNSRVVCSMFIPFFCVVSMVVLLLLGQFSDIKLLSFGSSSLLGTWGQIIYFFMCGFVVGVISLVFWRWRERPYREALTLEDYFLRSKIEKNDGTREEFRELSELLFGDIIENEALTQPNSRAAQGAVIDALPEGRRERLDRLFDIALVLLGILSASELQILTAMATYEQETAANLSYLLRIFTMPLLVLIIAWIAKEIFRNEMSANHRMIATEFCWNLWGFTLFYYLVVYVFATVVPQISQYGVYLSLGLTFLLIFFIQRAYKKVYTSMTDYFGRSKWAIYRFVAFFVAYIVVVLLVLPL